jgi:prevent-host-death family protein
MKTIPQRVLRNQIGSVLRQAETGQAFTITVAGRPVAQLSPIPRRHWVPKEAYVQHLRQTGQDPTFFDDVADLSNRCGS